MPPRKKNIVTVAESPTLQPPTPSITTSTLSMDDSILTSQEKPKVKTKREKKSSKHKVVAVVTPDGIQGSFQQEQKKPLIAQLPIHSSEIQFHDQPFTYDPTPPGALEGFDASEINPFTEDATYEEISHTSKNQNEYTNFHETVPNKNDLHKKNTDNESSTNSNQIQTTTTVQKEYGPQKLLICNQSSKVTHELPSSTSVACFWCCETFQGRPCVIPIAINDNIWSVYGNFCTPNCAMAYLLSESMDTHTRWERIALLNRLYSSTINGRVYPSPSRETLERFGGPINSHDFRKICESKQIRIDTCLPPMVSILASMDTKPIDFYETTLQNTFTNAQYQSIQKSTVESNTGLKLKRSKPLKDKESTLDACLQIKTR